MMKYYALFICDEWKSHVSKQLLGVFTKDKLIEVMEYNDFTLSQPVSISMTVKELNNSITYGYIEELSINEVL